MDISFLNPIWWLIPGIVLAGALSFYLYYREKKLKEIPVSRIKLLAAIRFIFILIIIILLTGPSLNIKKSIKENPVFIIAQDNSSSILLNKDSSFYKNEYIESLEELKSELGNTFDLEYLQFGDSVNRQEKADFSDNTTNFSDLEFAVKAGYSGKNVAGMLIASDGLYNQGKNPQQSFGDLPYPVFTIALGDTIRQPDALIQELNYNNIAFLNNNFPLRIYFRAYKLNNKELEINVLKNGKRLNKNTYKVNSDNESGHIDLKIEASEKGLQTYQVIIKPLEGEISLSNNEKIFSVNVIDNQQKILSLSNSPHPDIAAIKRALRKNKNFAVSSKTISQVPADISETDLLILHQIPSKSSSASSVLRLAEKKSMPVLFILGSQSNISAFNNLSYPMKVNLKQDAEDLAQPAYNKNFDKFTVSANLTDISDRLSPLMVHFGNYQFSSEHNVIFTQRINNIKTEKPLVAISRQDKSKSAYINGTGFWRWRMTDFSLNGSHDAFDEFINNLIQYLVTKSGGKQFSVEAEQIFSENQSVIFNAELYNEAYELTNEPVVNITISDSAGNTFEYDFSRTMNSYRLNPGSFETGKYSWTAEVEYNDKKYTEEGNFIVEPVSLEGLKTRADHHLLNFISNETGGRLFYPDETGQISKVISDSNIDKVKIISKSEQSVLLNLKWIFFLLIILITIEWFFRKYWGSY